LLRQAKERLESAGYEVVAGYMSPSHDLYVGPKARSLSTKFFPADVRLRIGKSLVDGDDVLELGAWEAQAKGRWPDYPEVTTELQDFIGELPLANEGLKGESGNVRVFYACGTDHAEKCGLYRGLCAGVDGDIGVVVVPREGDSPKAEKPEKLVFVAAPAAGEVASYSSTKVRTALQAKDAEYIAAAISPEAARLLTAPSEEELKAYPSLAM